jgi:hypothetical protein
MIDKCKVWGIGGIILTGKLKYSKRDLSQCHFVHYSSDMN